MKNILIGLFIFSVSPHSFSQENIDRYLDQYIKIEEKIEDWKNSKSIGNQVEFNEINKEKLLLQNEITYTISGIEIPPESSGQPNVEKVDLLNEVKSVLFPLVNSVKRASARPRKIEELNIEVDFHNARIDLYKGTIPSLEKSLLIPMPKNRKDVLSKILKEHKELLDHHQFMARKSARNLEEISQSKKSVYRIVKEAFSEFLQTKGKNILFAILTFFTLLTIFSVGRTKIFSSLTLSKKREWLKKPLFFLYHFFSIFIGILGSFFCLYILHDWFLITLGILGISAFFWSFKQVLPSMINEIRLAFNLGPVREQERIIFQGVPYQVVELGFYCVLSNERLSGGSIRIPAKKLLDQISREMDSAEPWFPSVVGDWVELQDGIFGEILFQSPELVSMRDHLSRKITYPTPVFLSLSPKNYSDGFTILSSLGLDYDLNQTIFGRVIPQIERLLKDKFSSLVSEKKIDPPTIQFEKADSSALNILAIINCSGQMAKSRFELERLLQKRLVEACFELSLLIPYPQVTLSSRGPIPCSIMNNAAE